MLGFHVCFEAFYKRIWTGRKFPRPKYNESVVNVWHDRDIEPRTYKNCPPPPICLFYMSVRQSSSERRFKFYRRVAIQVST